jgi:uncharacterized protein (DUF111 family)
MLAVLEVTAIDKEGKPSKNVPLTLAVDSGEAISPATINTNQQGQASCSLTYQQKGKRNITVKSNGISLGQQSLELPELRLQPPEITIPQPSQADVRLVSASLREDGRMIAVLEVTVEDKAGKGLENVPVRLKSEKNEAIFPATVNTNQQGQASCSLTYQQSGKRNITVTSDGISLGQQSLELPEHRLQPPDITIPQPSKATVLLVSSSLREDGRMIAVLEVTVKDKEGKALENVPVALKSEKNEAILPSTVNTNQQGQAFCSLTYQQKGKRNITVKSNGISLGQQSLELPEVRRQPPDITIPQPSQATVLLVSSSLREDGSTLAFLEVTVKDKEGKALENVPVALKSEKNDVILPSTVNTNQQGQAFCSLTYQQKGKRNITVTSNGIPLGQQSLELPELRRQPTEKRMVFLRVLGVDKAGTRPLPDATAHMNGTLIEDANQDGIFQTDIGDSQDSVQIQVQRTGYETPQGSSVYEDTLQIPPNVQNYFVSVTLFPMLFFVELPPDWEIPQKPGIGFVAKRSAQDKEGVQGRLDGGRVIFPYASFIRADGNVYVEMRQGSTLLRPGRGLTVKKYERI